MEDRSWQVLAVAVLFFILSWIAVGLRIYCRGWIVRSFGVDDTLMIGLVLIYTAYLITQIQGARYGIGRHGFDLTPEDSHVALMHWYICELLYVVSTCLLKISVGYFLLRVSIRRAHIWILRLLMLGTALFGTVYFFIVVFQCSPIPTFWEQSPRAADKCLSTTFFLPVTYAASIINCLADWAFGILPLFIISSHSLPKHIRILAFCILSFAAIGSIAAVIQSIYVPTLFDGDDFLWSTTDVVLWSTVEPGIGIMAASIATLRPLWQLLEHRFGSSPQAPHVVVRREQSQAKPSYVPGDGFDLRQDPPDPMADYEYPDENEVEIRSAFRQELPPIRVSHNRFSLSTSSRRSRASKKSDTARPAEDNRSEKFWRSAENVPSDDVESLVTSREDSDGGQWLCPSPHRDTDEDHDFEVEDGFNLTLMTTTHYAPTINWSSPRVSTISMGFGRSDRDSELSGAPSWGFGRCNGTNRISRASKMSGSAPDHNNSHRESKLSRHSNMMHSSSSIRANSTRANSIRANSIRANSVRANSIRATKLSSVRNANEASEASDDGAVADADAGSDDYAGTPSISRDPSPSPSPQGSTGSRAGRQGRTPPRASSRHALGSQFLAPPSLEFQLPSPPPSVWRGSAASGDATGSSQWFSSKMPDHPEHPDPRGRSVRTETRPDEPGL